MWTNPRRRSATVWSFALAGFACLVLWYMGWLPISLESPETGTLADRNGAMEGADLGDAGSGGPFLSSLDDEEDEESIDFDTADPVAFKSQTEPPVVEGASDESLLLPPKAPRLEQDESEEVEPPFRPPGSRGAKKSNLSDERFAARTDAPDGRSAKVGAEAPPKDPPVKVERIKATDEDGSVVRTGGETPEGGVPPPEAEAKLGEIDELLQSDQKLVAHRELSTLYWVKPQWRPFLQSRIEETALSIYFSDLPHYMPPYEIQSGDVLQNVAKQYDVPWEYLVRLNRIDPRRIRPGQKLKVIKGPFSARIDLRDFELTIHAHGYFVRRFRVGIGKDGTTPVGKFKVLTKLVNPTYYGPDGNVIDADDPLNPLGERWIDIGDGYGIHGTIDPQSIGRGESRGCIRLLNSDVEVVYDLLGVGSEVVIRK